MDENIGDLIALPDGRVLKTHGKDECSGTPCVIHSPSDHPLKNAPLSWRSDRVMMERVCEHGIGHPDPDDRAHWERRINGDNAQSKEFLDARAQHDCDGCCCPAWEPSPGEKVTGVSTQQIGQPIVTGYFHSSGVDGYSWLKVHEDDPETAQRYLARTDTLKPYEEGEDRELERLQEILRLYGVAWTEGHEHGPFPHLPDGGELRIVDALETVLRTMKFAQTRGFTTVEIDFLTEVIKYSLSDDKWTDEAIRYRRGDS
jgi:hypothetical protein